MKKYLLCLLIFSSCCEIQNIPARKEVIIFDFSQYTEKGFYFYIDKYPGEYKPLGVINIDYYPEYKVKETVWYSSDGIKHTSKSLIHTGISQEFLLNLVYEEALSLGANAVYNFSYKSISKRINECTTIDGMNIYCVAIKID